MTIYANAHGVVVPTVVGLRFAFALPRHLGQPGSLIVRNLHTIS